MEGKCVVEKTNGLQSKETKTNQENEGSGGVIIINEEEQRKVVIMRDLAEKQDPSAKVYFFHL